MLMLLSLSGKSSISWAQQDSSKLSLAELKQTAGLLTEVEFRRDEAQIVQEKINVYEGMIKHYQENESDYEQKLRNQELINENSKPAWYDHFWVGSTVVGIVLTTIFLFAK
jgi:hypothetical protein